MTPAWEFSNAGNQIVEQYVDWLQKYTRWPSNHVLVGRAAITFSNHAAETLTASDGHRNILLGTFHHPGSTGLRLYVYNYHQKIDGVRVTRAARVWFHFFCFERATWRSPKHHPVYEGIYLFFVCCTSTARCAGTIVSSLPISRTKSGRVRRLGIVGREEVYVRGRMRPDSRDGAWCRGMKPWKRT